MEAGLFEVVFLGAGMGAAEVGFLGVVSATIAAESVFSGVVGVAAAVTGVTGVAAAGPGVFTLLGVVDCSGAPAS